MRTVRAEHLPTRHLLRRKPEKRDVITIGVPVSTKRLWEELGKLADEQDFDLTGSISTALVGLIKQAKGELERYGAMRQDKHEPAQQSYSAAP